MKLTADDVVVYLYTIGTVVSSVWVAQHWLGSGRFTLLAASAVLALAWTAYFWIGIGPRLRIERGAKREEDGANREGDGAKRGQ